MSEISVDIREVIVVVFPRGEGVAGDPCRLVVGVYEKGGTLIAENDPYMEPDHD